MTAENVPAASLHDTERAETEMRRPSRRLVTVTTEWHAVGQPAMCRCGHPHYGWITASRPGLAPQWTFCDDESCPCRGLRRVPAAPLAAPVRQTNGEEKR